MQSFQSEKYKHADKALDICIQKEIKNLTYTWGAVSKTPDIKWNLTK